ncbi:conserved Plasmodium protein, unknown function [Plasmodium ovale wallikeri]|uniref:C2H2-type domain-containing protein n=2 Tax=Plasmodium ovale TaxID=36330 RepID=A0A1A8ZEB1_PLAOA|nr:conserved Plasmodium protein, unknown function [Plasmodium ovale wallikeri]SBT42201.1 conserved Plasmodium protein, unknown function [Plasmodium ovale wallikeri]SBT78253.1 conserved Plasmodium protein, unknown function [Plasmodium ovale]
MVEISSTKGVERKRKKPYNVEEGKDDTGGKTKKKIEFENDEEYEKYLLSNFKKNNGNNDNEYIFSEMIKNLYNEIKKYKTVNDMANEIKRLAFESISKNLQLICNNECTSSFFIEKYRVKYMNEQTQMNIKSAQYYFKEFMILYNNGNFDNFSLEVNTNVENKKDESNEEEEVEKNTTKGESANGDTTANASANTNANTNVTHVMTKENMYETNIWKEKIKCKIENISEHNNILIKIVSYLSSVALHVDHIPVKIKKFDIVKKLNALNYDILNINIWDTYNYKESRPILTSSSSSPPSPSFYRKANLYFKKQNKTNELLNATREKPYSIDINGWYLNNIKRNNYNYVDFRVCPPIFSHIERVKIDYENAKIAVRKLDKSCNINSDFMVDIKEEAYFEDRVKKRKLGKGTKEDLTGENTAKDANEDAVVNDTNAVDALAEGGDVEEDSPIIHMIEKEENMCVTKKLDILILYLRFVHNFCYYSARKFNTYDEMIRECGYFYLRVNLDNKFYTNLIPIFYENYNVKKLEFHVGEKFTNDLSSYGRTNMGEDPSNIQRSVDNANDQCGNAELLAEENCHNNNNCSNSEESKLEIVKKRFFADLGAVSTYQLKWLLNFDEEIEDALKASYNEHIDIEKTKEFFDILQEKYILKTGGNNVAKKVDGDDKSGEITTCSTTASSGKVEIRCAKCRKLFNSITDVPNHIFIKHSQIKMKLITETEVQIMQRYFYETPHSFHFLFMMEKKYNANNPKNYLNKGFFKKTKNYKNQNFHLLTNSAKNYKDFDDPNVNVFENIKQSVKKKNDFYDDT